MGGDSWAGQGSGQGAYHHEGDIGVDALTLNGVLHGHHSRLRALRVLSQCALHLSCPDPVPADIDDVIHPPCALQLLRLYMEAADHARNGSAPLPRCTARVCLRPPQTLTQGKLLSSRQ